MARHLMAAAVLLMAAGIVGAQAEDYPARTVTIIVPFAAGGPADITGRIVADIFNHHLGQKFVVENAEAPVAQPILRATGDVIASAAKQSILPQ